MQTLTITQGGLTAMLQTPINKGVDFAERPITLMQNESFTELQFAQLHKLTIDLDHLRDTSVSLCNLDFGSLRVEREADTFFITGDSGACLHLPFAYVARLRSVWIIFNQIQLLLAETALPADSFAAPISRATPFFVKNDFISIGFTADLGLLCDVNNRTIKLDRALAEKIIDLDAQKQITLCIGDEFVSVVANVASTLQAFTFNQSSWELFMMSITLYLTLDAQLDK